MDKARQQRILDCRYYNGEEKAPEDVHGLFWDYERAWANSMYKDNWECEEQDLRLLGLENFEPYDGTPYGLKCLLFNRYCHWSYGCTKESFLKWYKEHYQQPRLTNRQRRFIKRKNDLIKRCRFYKGEELCPFEECSKDEHFWKYEKMWVEKLANSYKNAEPLRLDLENHPPIKSFALSKGLPSSLIGLFINRDEHWIGRVVDEEFISALKKFYLKERRRDALCRD